MIFVNNAVDNDDYDEKRKLHDKKGRIRRELEKLKDIESVNIRKTKLEKNIQELNEFIEFEDNCRKEQEELQNKINNMVKEKHKISRKIQDMRPCDSHVDIDEKLKRLKREKSNITNPDWVEERTFALEERLLIII
jgi:hypothetical protein